MRIVNPPQDSRNEFWPKGSFLTYKGFRLREAEVIAKPDNQLSNITAGAVWNSVESGSSRAAVTGNDAPSRI